MRKISFLIAFLIVNVMFSQNFTESIHNYINTNHVKLGLQIQDFENIQVTSHGFSKSMQLHNVYVTQQYQGIDIFKTSSSFAVKNNVVINANLSFIDNLSRKTNTVTPLINASTAIIKATNFLNIQNPINLTLLETVSNNSYKYSDGEISLSDIPVKLVFQKIDKNTLRLAWDLSIYLLDASHYYSVRIDAVSGELLETDDFVISCNFDTNSPNDNHKTPSVFPQDYSNESLASMVGDGARYRVFPLPLESPNHGPEALVADPSDVNASPFGWHDTNGVAGAEFTITRGNNVYAQDDINGDNGFGASPNGGVTLNFDFPYNFQTNPQNMIEATTVNLFYWNNIMHDVWYQYGFDEENGNFQETNYSGLGNGGDSVTADAQDGSGFNNANFGTPPDGGNPRMQMFLWSASTGPVDILTINGGLLDGVYSGVPANFGGDIPIPPLTEDLVLVEDFAIGANIDINDACDLISNTASLNGKIAVIRRGECEFGFKALAAQNQGAIAVIMVNNVAGDPTIMAGGALGDQVTIPLFMLTNIDGEAIINQLNTGNAVNGTITGENVSYNIDGDLDNGVVCHEYGHGISTRLTGGALNSSCLFNSDQMGEGWSDWFALMLTMKVSDLPGDARGMSTYAFGQDTNGSGIRNAPYSTDFSVNNFTYANTNSGVSVPHGIGFVWATMLWDLNWALIDQYGFDPDVYNGTGGNNIAMQLVIDGLKLQACNPGFVDGRDAIIQADELANEGVNFCLIWDVFARRGLGLSASQGDPFDRTDQVEAFDLPAACLLGLNNDTLDNNFTVYPNPTDGFVNIASRVNIGKATVSIYDINGTKVISEKVELNDIVNFDMKNISAGVYVIQIKGDKFTYTSKLVIK
jgi:hypothetical protein